MSFASRCGRQSAHFFASRSSKNQSLTRLRDRGSSPCHPPLRGVLHWAAAGIWLVAGSLRPNVFGCAHTDYCLEAAAAAVMKRLQRRGAT